METENSLLTNIDLLVPSSPSISTIPKSLFIQYKVSLETSSNTTSQILLKSTWDKHFQEFTKLGLDKTLATTDKNPNSVNWTSSLSKFGEPELMFEKSLHCPNKCSQAPVKCFGLNSFVKYLNETEHSHEKVVIKENMMPAYPAPSELNNAPKIPIFKPKLEKSKPSKNNDFHEINLPDKSLLGASEQFHKCDDDEEENKIHKSNIAKITFKTAREQLIGQKRTLGASRKSQNKFVSPMIRHEKTEELPCITDERLKHIDPKMIELIESEIIDRSIPVGWDDVAGLEMAKSVIQEAVVWPLLRPDIFTGLRRPPKGILLFGPPGTGKTLIGKCVASQCRATFFSISASSLTSKWIGDGEKMVRALFAVARCHQPAVVFIDEIDSLLTQRSDSEHESTRRIKTEFLVQLDGAATGEDDRLLIIGATNRPQELDEAARRRLVKRLYIPLPDVNARKQIIINLLKSENNDLKANDIDAIAASTDGYSGADMKSLCSDAAMGPIRALPLSQIVQIESEQVRPLNFNDFKAALQRVKPSVSQSDLTLYENWNKTYGHGF